MSYAIQLGSLRNPEPIYQSCMSSSDPIFITENGREQMVLLNVSAYRKLYAKMQVYQALEKGEADIVAGRESDAFEMLDRVGTASHV